MRREKRTALLLLSVSLLLFAGCGQKKSKEATNSAVPGTASVSEESAATGTAAEAEETLSGVVLEASMNGFTLQNKDRGLIYIATGEDAAEKPDLTRLANGIVPGEGVRLLGKTEDGTFQLGAAADEAALKLLPRGRRKENKLGIGPVGSYLPGARQVDLEENGVTGVESLVDRAARGPILVFPMNKRPLQHVSPFDHRIELLGGNKVVVDAVQFTGSRIASRC